jgi:putative ABC transport system permease protein
MPDPPLPADWAREVRTRLAPLRLSPTREADIVDELSQHLDDRYRELRAGGASDADATRLTLAEFREGNLLARYMAPLRQSNTMSSSTPESAPGRLLPDVWQDLRYATRTFFRQRGFAAAAVLTVALGVGANSAIFSVVRGVLLESLPFKDAERLYRLRMVYPDGSAYTTLSPPDFMSVREANRVFDEVEAYTRGVVTMLGGGEPQEVRAASISDGLFELLGLRVVVGRGFVAEEHTPGRNGVAVLDHGFWQRTFGGDEGAIGRSITIGGVRYSIVGVLAQGARLPADVPGARVPSEADVYLPIEYGEAFSATAAAQRRSNYLGVLARAKAGVTPALIDEDLRRIGSELQAAFPRTNEGLTMNAISARELIVGDVRKPLLILLGAVGFVLLVACANVASLMLARASARRDELAVRAALGARRGRLLRQLLTEAVVLGLVGGTLGLALAYTGTEALVAAQPADIPRLEEIRLDRTVVFFTFAITLLASLVFGALPALQATGHLTRGLRTGRRGGGPDRNAQRVRAALVVTEVALAVVLLAGAGLLLRSLVALTQVAPGFTTENAMSFRIALYGRGYDLNTVRTRVTEFETALHLLPSVTAVAATSVLPLSGPGPRLAFSVEGAPPPPADVNPEIGVASVTPDYLKTIGATLVMGRDFTNRDHGEAPLVAIINEAAVRRWFPDGKPIGKQVQMSGTREIVGVIADVLQGDPRQQTVPQLFVPYPQRPTRSLWLVVRTAANPRMVAPSIRATIRRFDANLAVSELTLLDQLRAGAIARPRFYTTLLALFAVVALALAVTGIFGVMSYTVAERTREIGIRMALGAHRADVLRMIVGRAVALALTGAVIGLAAALAIGRVMRNQLFGVDVLDPPTLSAVILILLTSVAAASLLPAQRAARLDPGTTLRHG